MKTFIRQNILVISMILLGALLFCWVLVYEFQQQSKLLNENKALLEQTVAQRFQNYLTKKIETHPYDVAYLKKHWRKVAPDFFVIQNGEQKFPFLFSSVTQQDQPSSKEEIILWADLWAFYKQETDQQNLHSSHDERTIRARMVRNIASAIKTNQQNEVRASVAEFLNHRSHYRLSPLDEMLSTLAIFELDDQNRWNREFTEALLFDGWPTKSNRLPAVADYLLVDNSTLNTSELKAIFEILLSIAQEKSIKTDIFQQHFSFLFERPKDLLNKRINELEPGQWMVDQRYIVKTFHSQYNKKTVLYKAVSLDALLTSFLKNQSAFLLHENDVVALRQESFDSDKVPLNRLAVKITRPHWERISSQQLYFLWVKILAVIGLMFFVLLSFYFFNQRLQREQRYLKMREDFINMVGHELKTPLASIGVMTETLVKRMKKDLPIVDYPDRILTETDRLQLLIDNLLSINRFKSGLMNLHLSTVNLKQEILQFVEHFIGYQKKEVVVHHDIPDHVLIMMDSVFFHLLLRNLLSNAIKYNLHDSVSIDMSYDEPRHCILIKDNGIGIDKDEQEKVFDKFYRSSQGVVAEGAGLGLALCQAIMEAHKGSIEIVDSGDHGTTWALFFGGLTSHS